MNGGSEMFSIHNPNDRQYTVTGRIRAITQPRGGYINPKIFKRISFNDGNTLSEESVHATTVGMVVDYLTRYNHGCSVEEAFEISAKGAKLAGRMQEFCGYISKIKGVDDDSIRNACYAVWFDQIFRKGAILSNHGPTEITVDHATCNNIRTMLDRSTKFLSEYGPVIMFKPLFPGGYSNVVTDGDGDFITEDTLWDFKVSKKPLDSNSTLQLAMYFIMSQRSNVPEYRSLRKVGAFNPRLNEAFILEMKDVPEETIKAIEKDVICYD